MKSRNNTSLQLIDIDNVKSDYCCSFVRPIENEETCQKHVEETENEKGCLDGQSARAFYEDLVKSNDNEEVKYCAERNRAPVRGSSSSGKRVIKRNSQKTRVVKPESESESRQHLTSKLLNIVSQGDVEYLQLFTSSLKERDDFEDILNGRDQFGWTPLMCASAQGNLDMVKFLVEEGSLKNIEEYSGKTVFDICTKMKYKEILEFLNTFTKRKTERCRAEFRRNEDGETSTNDRNAIESCEMCGSTYLLSERKQHLASMMHIFHNKEKIVGTTFQIPTNNKGYQMLLGSGWDSKQGLGPEGSGCKNPVKTVLKHDRKGLGIEDCKKARVTHFFAFDESAVKRQLPERKVKKDPSVKGYEKKKIRDKAWERNMRHHMSSDF